MAEENKLKNYSCYRYTKEAELGLSEREINVLCLNFNFTVVSDLKAFINVTWFGGIDKGMNK